MSEKIPTPTYPGIDLEQNRGPDMIAAGSVFIIFTLIVIIMRFFSRVWTKISIDTDDWLILAAAIFSWAYTALVLVEVESNFYGQHVGHSDLQHVAEFHKQLYGLAIIYPIALTLSKLSLLALYWRIFRVTKARIPLIIAASLNVAWAAAAVLVGIFACSPIRGFWDPSSDPKCINYPIFFLANEAWTITLDLIVLFMPVYFIAQLKRSVAERISISSTFLLGLVATVISALRLWRLVLASRKPGFDPTFNDTDAALWAILEIHLWILVASIPAFRPMLGKMKTKNVTQRIPSGGSNSSGSRGIRARLWRWGSESSQPKVDDPPSGSEQAIDSLKHNKAVDYNVNVLSNPLEATSRSLGDVTIPENAQRVPLNGGIRVDHEVQVNSGVQRLSEKFGSSAV